MDRRSQRLEAAFLGRCPKVLGLLFAEAATFLSGLLAFVATSPLSRRAMLIGGFS
jgi:hypothetical protein